MSQPYYPNNYSQQYYHPGYDTTQPAQIQSQTYTNDYVRYESDVAPSAQPASDSSDLYSQVDYATTNNSSNLGQTFTYSQVDYATDNAANNFSSYNPAPEHVGSRYPDSVNQIPHQPQVVPGRNWDHPVQYAEVPVVHPGDLHDQRRNSCASGTDGNVWYSQENASHYSQPAYEQTQHANHQAPTFRQQQDPMNLGMYSPTQYSQTRHIAHDAAFDAVDHSKVEVPYGSLPIHEGAHCEQQSSNTAYQTFDNSSVGYHSAQSSPTFTQAHYSSNDSSPPASPIEEHSDQSDQDLFAQQRRAAGYQHVLQANQELKYQLSGQFQQFEANQQRQDGYTSSQEYARHHPYQRPTHHRQSPSSEHSRLMTAPIVPSQAHERIPPIVQASPKAQGKKVVVSKKPALACKFCRKRKIACGAPPPTNLDRTCNQCARRGLECCYPTESRRGIRKTPKEPVPEEPTVHKFVPSDGSAHEGGVGPVRRGRKRASN